VADTRKGNAPPRAAIGRQEAVALAREALSRYAGESGSDAAAYTDNVFNPETFLFGEGNELRWMYRFVIPLAAPLFGEYEVMVDGTLGQIFSARNLARR